MAVKAQTPSTNPNAKIEGKVEGKVEGKFEGKIESRPAQKIGDNFLRRPSAPLPRSGLPM